MDKEFALQVSAMLGAHERLIRDLILARIEREEGPLDAIESYIERIRNIAIFVDRLNVHATESDQLNQMITEAIERTLNGVRKEIMDRLRLEHQQKNRPAE